MVKIKAGPFYGIEGCIDSVKPSGKVLLKIDMIGQAVPVEVSKNYITFDRTNKYYWRIL